LRKGGNDADGPIPVCLIGDQRAPDELPCVLTRPAVFAATLDNRVSTTAVTNPTSTARITTEVKHPAIAFCTAAVTRFFIVIPYPNYKQPIRNSLSTRRIWRALDRFNGDRTLHTRVKSVPQVRAVL
jgi:hypothetical protein